MNQFLDKAQDFVPHWNEDALDQLRNNTRFSNIFGDIDQVINGDPSLRSRIIEGNFSFNQDFLLLKMQKKYSGEEDGTAADSMFEKIKYLWNHELSNYQIQIKDNVIFSSQSSKLNDGRYLFVMDPQGNLFAADITTRNFKHSSFTRGKEVAFAGTFQVDKGKLVHLNNESGHYLPTSTFMDQLLDLLRKNNPEIDSVVK